MYIKSLSITLILLLTCSFKGYTQLKDGDQINFTAVAAYLEPLLSVTTFHDHLRCLSSDLPYEMSYYYATHTDPYYRLISLLKSSWETHTRSRSVNTIADVKHWFESWGTKVKKGIPFQAIAQNFTKKCENDLSLFIQTPYTAATTYNTEIHTLYNDMATQVTAELSGYTSNLGPMQLAYQLKVPETPLLEAYNRCSVEMTETGDADRKRTYLQNLLHSIIYIHLSHNGIDETWERSQYNLQSKHYQLERLDFVGAEQRIKIKAALCALKDPTIAALKKYFTSPKHVTPPTAPTHFRPPAGNK